MIGATNKAGKKLAVLIFLISNNPLTAIPSRIKPPVAVSSFIIEAVAIVCT